MVVYKGYRVEGQFMSYRVFCEKCDSLLLEKRVIDGTYEFSLSDCPHYRWYFFGNACPIVLRHFGRLVRESADWVKAEYGYYFLFPR